MAAKIKHTVYRDKNSGEKLQIPGAGKPPHADCEKLYEVHEEEPKAKAAPAPAE